jgi:hypothetical protein
MSIGIPELELIALEVYALGRSYEIDARRKELSARCKSLVRIPGRPAIGYSSTLQGAAGPVQGVRAILATLSQFEQSLQKQIYEAAQPRTHQYQIKAIRSSQP